MKGALLIATLLLILLPVGTLGLGIPDDLKIITEDNTPLNYMDNGTLKGITVELMEAVLARTGSNLTRESFTVMPWNEGYALVRSTPDTMLLSMARLPEREEQFLWAGPVITIPEVLFTEKSSEQNEITDISSLRIVAITDDCAKSFAISSGADEKKIIEVPGIPDAISLVENGSADAWAYNDQAGLQAINQYAKEPGRFRIDREIGTSRVFMAFNLNTSEEFVREVNTTIQQLKRDRSDKGMTEYEKILVRYQQVQCSLHSTEENAVTGLVNRTADAIAVDARGTIADINAGKAPYRDPADKELYAFVFDTKVVLVANAQNTLNNGKNLSGTTDVTGKAFRDEMVTGALQNGTGWVSYIYSNPDSLGLYQKNSYYRLANGSDGTAYVVGAGRYVTCDENTAINES